MKPPKVYLDFLTKEKFSLSHDLWKHAKQIGALRTMSSVYIRDIRDAQKRLNRYFNRSFHRPYNCLLLGPPGSGKSFVAEQLARFGPDNLDDAVGRSLLPKPEGATITGAEVKLFSYNLSQLQRPDDLTEILHEIAKAVSEPKIVLLDEFDVRIGGSSVIRYLIEPMYDAKFGKHRTLLGKTAFIFSGSYLTDKALLRKIQKAQSLVDLPRLVFEYYCNTEITKHDENWRNEDVNNLFHICDVYRKYQEEMAPDSQTARYLRQLNKLRDFLSRINGFQIELPDLSAPLDITHPSQALWSRSKSCDHPDLQCLQGNGVAEKVMEWVDVEEEELRRTPSIAKQFKFCTAAGEPILQYKDMLLKERLLVLLTMFDSDRKIRRRKKVPPPGHKWQSHTVVVMKQSLLNYLCTVPLVYGMRSIYTLMWNLMADPDKPEYDDQGREQYRLTLGDEENVTRHVRQDGDYQDQLRLWENIKKTNKIETKPDRDIRVVLDGKDE
jgi:ATPase family associated with various cellular activities (AAA)